MKRILFILALAALSTTVFAALNGYTFTYSLGTYSEITGGSLLGNTTSDDQRFVDPAVPLGGTTTTGVGFPIGFDFIFDGITYNRVAINNNGWISLGQSALTPAVNNSSTSAYTPLSSTTAITPADLVARIAGVGRDLQAQTGAELRIQTVGSAGNYELVVQWKNYRKYGATGDSYNFQIRLQQSGNKVVVKYGTMTNNTTSTTVQVGLRGSPATTASNFKILKTDTVTPSWNPPITGTLATDAMTLSSTVYPSSGTTYTFEAPLVGVLNVTPNPISFGSVSVGDTKTIPVSLSNSGGSNFTVNSMSLTTGTVFTIPTPPSLPQTLTPGGAPLTFNMVYTPTGTAGDADVLNINDSRSNSTWNVTGTGVVGDICQFPYLATLPLVDYNGTTAGYTNDYTSAMFTGLGNSSYVGGKDWVAKFTIPSLGMLDVSLTNQTGYSSQYMGMFLVSTIPSVATPAAVLAQAYGANAPQNITGYSITPGDYYLIVDNWPTPDNIYFVLNITFTAATNPPNPANLVSPTPSGTSGILPTATLNWSTGGGTVEKYYLYFGTDGLGATPPTNIENGTDLGLLTTYNPTPDMQYGITYYWQIVPWNSIGGYATGCPIWSFTIMPDPTIYYPNLPYTQYFDGVTAPAWPVGWSKVGTTGSAYTQASSSYSSPNCAYIAYSAVVGLPPVNMASPTVLRMKFWARGNYTAGDVLSIGYLTNPSDATTFTLIESKTISSLTYSEYTVNLGTVTGLIYYAIKAGPSYSMLFDNVRLEEIPPIPVFSITPASKDFGGVILGYSSTQDFTITNTGGGTLTIAASDITITGTNQSEFSRTASDISLGAGLSAQISVTFTPASQGLKSANLQIIDNVSKATDIIPLSGEGLNSPPWRFENGWDGWIVENGNQANQWYVGTATYHTGTHSAYISNDVGVTNAYTVGTASTVHFYRDVVFPPGITDYSLRFFWKGQGEGATYYYDYLRVYLVDTTVDPVAGTELTSGQLGGTYNLQGLWQYVNIPLTGVAGTTKRLVFSWRNDSSLGTQPPAAVDDIGIFYDGDIPLPVELSSFSAVLTAENLVNLTWVTQSETGVQGYYIYRSNSEVLEDAILISPLVEATNSSEQHSYTYTDSELFEEGMYYYWLQNVDLNGNVDFHGPVSVNFSTTNEEITPEIPTVTELKSIYPNPFNPTAVIPFSIAKTAKVEIRIFNTRGQLLRHFNLAERAPGYYQVAWDGKDFNGNSCSSGIYYIVMNAGKETFQRKAVLQK